MYVCVCVCVFVGGGWLFIIQWWASRQEHAETLLFAKRYCRSKENVVISRYPPVLHLFITACIDVLIELINKNG